MQTKQAKKSQLQQKNKTLEIFDEATETKQQNPDVLERFFRGYERQPQRAEVVKPLKREVLFNAKEYFEDKKVKEDIRRLMEEIHQIGKKITEASTELKSEVEQLQKITVNNSSSQEQGIYHVRFLEIVLSLLQTIWEKVGESKTWLQAMISKKKKRGSLFVARSKKMGTQYSLSQELQSARSVQ